MDRPISKSENKLKILILINLNKMLPSMPQKTMKGKVTLTILSIIINEKIKPDFNK